MNTNAACCLPTCYTHCDGVPSCIRFLKLATTILSEEIAVSITDKFGHVYRLVADTDAEGIALLDLDSTFLPEGLLNPYAGEFDLTVAGMKFPVEDTFYECLRFSVVKTFSVAGDEPSPDELSTYPTYELPYVYEVL